MTKPFITAFVKDLEGQVSRGEISYSRMVELLNEKAISWASSQDGWVDVKERLPEIEKGYPHSTNSSYVLGYSHGHYYSDVFYNSIAKAWWRNHISIPTEIEVTPWRPLPPSPQNTKP